MKKNIKLILVLCLILCIFIYHTEVINSIQNATSLFQKSIFPSLFPFMIVSPFLINYGFLDIAKTIIGPWMKKLFHLSENTSYVFVMSMLSGFPGSAIYAKELYEKKLITKKEVEHLILFCHFPNPIFAITMIPNKPFLVLIVNYSLNIFIGFLYRNKQVNNYIIKNIDKTKENFFIIFTNTIKNAMNNSLFILGVIVFFFMLSSILNNPISNIFLEISQGLNYLKNLNMITQLKSAIAGAILAFGGLSVHLQTYGILSELNFDYLKYLKTRLLSALLSFLIISFI